MNNISINTLLQAKARQVLASYSEAMGVPVVLANRADSIEKSKFEKQQIFALNETRKKEETCIYKCPKGQIYMASPFFRKGHYAGAILTGEVSGDKTQNDIQAMANLLEVCAGVISEKDDFSGYMLRRKIRREEKSDIPEVKPMDSELIMEMERLLLAAFRRGDIETGKKQIKNIFNIISESHPENREIIRFRAIELVVLLSRHAAGNEIDHRELLENNNRYIKRIQESESTEEIITNLLSITERIAGKVFSFRGFRHSSVLRKAERFIWNNYTRKISLEEIARASGLSAPYFSTIFKEEMGENLSSYLNRLRVEKAANLLTASEKSLSKIAEICGFEDQSWFSKIFKKIQGVSPGKYREQGTGSAIINSEKKEQGVKK